MQIFITGASGYIGGSVAAALIAAGHSVSGLTRSVATAEALSARGITPVGGTLDDAAVLASAAQAADVTIGAANADHRASAEAIVTALTGSGKTYLHTSGSSIVGTPADGEFVPAIFDEDTPFTPSPARVARVAIDAMVRGAQGMRGMPWLIALARKVGIAKHIGPGENRWANVHIDDLVPLYLLAIAKAPPGGFYFAENGEASMREVCEAISRMLGQGGRTEAMSVAEAAAEWGEGAARNTMGSNSRVRAKRALADLGWMPSASSLFDEIAHGCYASDGG